ncbi:MAG: leucine-rich repeat domain-containing protein, partial [Ruminococcaceae bacterium]|nr:leucine-rich repeat domain-containing protein [Oscillospiraceae bacterium]
MKRRILSFALALVMLLSILPVQAFATDSEIAYAVEGGNLYFDTATGKITRCDATVTSANIPAEIDGVPVRLIGVSAFDGCESLKSVTIPDSVTDIGDYAFEKCSNLQTISIGSGVTYLGIFAFAWCTSLESAVLSDGLTTVGREAFFGCSSLTNISIPDSVRNIGQDIVGYTAFYNDDANWDGDVLYIGKHLIKARQTLEGAYDIREDTLTIAEYAFSKCDSLTNVTIPNGVVNIAYGAFYKCSALTDMIIPESVVSLGANAFYDCTSLANVMLCDVALRMEASAFYGTALYNDVGNWDDGVLYIGKHLIKAEMTLADGFTIREDTLTIAGYALCGCTCLTQIVIPESVVLIGTDAFSDCSALTNAIIGNAVTDIGRNAFRDCSAMTSVTIGSSVASIGEYAFYDCAALNDVYYIGTKAQWQKIEIATGNAAVKYATFHFDKAYAVEGGNIYFDKDSGTIFDCDESVTSADIPAKIDGVTVTQIGVEAFAQCDALTSVKIPDSVTNIGAWAFFHCEKLAHVTIGGAVELIGDGAFYGCGSLTSIEIPDSVVAIGEYTFYNCATLTSITIGSGVVNIGQSAFYGCDALADVYYNDTQAAWNEIYMNENNEPLRNATIHFAVVAYAVEGGNIYFDKTSGTIIGCDETVTIAMIPDEIDGVAVTAIGNYAFYDCQWLTNVTIGSSVTSIGDVAFYDCPSLTDVHYDGTEEMWNEIVIGDHNDDLLDAAIYFLVEETTEPTEETTEPTEETTEP